MPVKSHILSTGQLSFGEVGSEQEFGSQVTSVKLEPSYDAEDNIAVLSGEEEAGAETESWELTGEFLQEYGTASLLQWCYDNSGTVLPFDFSPSAEGVLAATGNVLIRATAIGGDVKAKNKAEFTFKVIGRPTITSPAPV